MMKVVLVIIGAVCGLFALSGISPSGSSSVDVPQLSCETISQAQIFMSSWMLLLGLAGIFAAVLLLVACGDIRFANSKWMLVIAGIALLCAGLFAILVSLVSTKISCDEIIAAAQRDAGSSGTSLFSFLFFGSISALTIASATRAR